MLGQDGRRPGLELGAAGQAPPERDDLLGHRFAAPCGEQELLGQRPQVDGVGLAPGQRIARQRQRGADREQGVGPHRGDAGAGRVERSELLPPRGRLQELRRNAAQRVLGPGEVVGPHRNDHGRFVGFPVLGPVDDLPVGDGVLGRRLRCGHGVGPPQRVRGPVAGQHVAGQYVAAGQHVAGHYVAGQHVAGHYVVGQHVVGQHVVGHYDPRIVVGERPVEYRGALAVPGLFGLAVVVGEAGARTGRRPAGGTLVLPPAQAPPARALPARAPPTHARHHEPHRGDPGHHDNGRDGVDHPPGRERPVGDAGAGLGPLRRPRRLGRAEQEDGRRRRADDHQQGERVPDGRRGREPQCGAPSRGLSGGSRRASPRPGGSSDTSDDCTVRAGSSTSRIHPFGRCEHY